MVNAATKLPVIINCSLLILIVGFVLTLGYKVAALKGESEVLKSVYTSQIPEFQALASTVKELELTLAGIKPILETLVAQEIPPKIQVEQNARVNKRLDRLEALLNARPRPHPGMGGQ